MYICMCMLRLINLTFKNMKRHAQTQHSATNVENILLLKKHIYDVCKDDIDWQRESCTWFYEVSPKDQQPEHSDVICNDNDIIQKKRKNNDLQEGTALKKTKLGTKALKAKRPGFTEDRYEETSYYFENGLRKVYPYYFTFTTFAKGRWIGEKILNVFKREFRAQSIEEYERCIKAGTITVNCEPISTDYQLKHNDLLANIVHRHEVPVTNESISLVHVDDDIVVVNKPASIPVHPCGRYRHNTMVFILAKEYNLKNLRTIHRLDRLTSGLLIFGRTPNIARQIEFQIRNRQVEKEYFCRVEGNFPDGVIDCNEPIEVISYKIGVCKVSKKGKECTTSFKKIGFNGKSSVILCKPLTGRMHQIRVHLQYLGFPILNDPLYNHEVFGPLKGRGGDFGGKTEEELIEDLVNIHNAENWLGLEKDDDLPVGNHWEKRDMQSNSKYTNSGEKFHHYSQPKSITSTDCTEDVLPSNRKTKLLEQSQYITDSHVKATVSTQTSHYFHDRNLNPNKLSIDEYCIECKIRYKDPRPSDLMMYLHAWKYKGPGWEYETELPNWACIDWVDK